MEKCQIIQKRIEDGKIKLKNFNSSLAIENDLGLMENRLRSSGVFSQDLPHCGSSRRSEKTCKIKTLNLNNFEGRLIFMTKFNDIDWTKRGNSENCMSNSEQVENYAKRFSRRHWSYFGLGDEKNWYGTLNFSPEGEWGSIATEMVGHFKETGQPDFMSISAFLVVEF